MTQVIRILGAGESLSGAKPGDLLIAPEANGLVLIWRIGDDREFEPVGVASSIAAALALIEAGGGAEATDLRVPKPRRPTPLEVGVKSVVAARLRERYHHMAVRQPTRNEWSSIPRGHESGKEQDSGDTNWRRYLRGYGNRPGRH